MHPTVDDTIPRLRPAPGTATGPTALLAVLAIVIVALAIGLAAVILTGPSVAPMP